MCEPGAIFAARASPTATPKKALADLTTPLPKSCFAISEPVAPAAISIAISASVIYFVTAVPSEQEKSGAADVLRSS